MVVSLYTDQHNALDMRPDLTISFFCSSCAVTQLEYVKKEGKI